MIWRLAWQNVTHKRLRAIASIGGVAFSILLMFMQLGIFSAAEKSAELVYHALDFDIAITSPQYVFLASAGTVPREAILRARDVTGIASVVPLNVGFALYRNTEDGLRRGLLLFGVDPDDIPFLDPEIQQQREKLYTDGAALMDREARGEYGRRDVGDASDLGAGSFTIAGHYLLGTGFIAGADAIVSNDTYLRLMPGTRADRPSLGLVKIEEGGNVQKIAERLQRALPANVAVRTRHEIEGIERNYFVNVKPIGIMFRSGVIVGFLVGAVTLYQILATQVANHMKEFATLKAMGYTDRAVYGVVIAEGFIYAAIGFVPAYFGGVGLYRILQKGAMVPVWMTVERAVFVLILTIIMCTVSSLLAVRKVASADPAELFA